MASKLPALQSNGGAARAHAHVHHALENGDHAHHAPFRYYIDSEQNLISHSLSQQGLAYFSLIKHLQGSKMERNRSQLIHAHNKSVNLNSFGENSIVPQNQIISHPQKSHESFLNSLKSKHARKPSSHCRPFDFKHSRTVPTHNDYDKFLEENESEVIRIGFLEELSFTLPQSLFFLRQVINHFLTHDFRSFHPEFLKSIYIEPEGKLTIYQGHKTQTEGSAFCQKGIQWKVSEEKKAEKILQKIQVALAPQLDDFWKYQHHYFLNLKKKPKLKEIISLIHIYSGCFKIKLPNGISEGTLTNLKLLQFKQQQLYIKRRHALQEEEIFDRKAKIGHRRNNLSLLLKKQSSEKPHQAFADISSKKIKTEISQGPEPPSFVRGKGGKNKESVSKNSETNLTKKSQLSTICYESSRRWSHSKVSSTLFLESQRNAKKSLEKQSALQVPVSMIPGKAKFLEKKPSKKIQIDETILEQSKSDIREASNFSMRNTIENELQERSMMEELKVESSGQARGTIYFGRKGVHYDRAE